MENWPVIAAVAAVIGLIIFKTIYDKVTIKRRMRSYFKKIYGKVPENNYESGRYEYIDYYFKHKTHQNDVIDDITWNDLEMEDIYKLLNQTSTGIGEEYLYAALREPFYEAEPLRKRDAVISWFEGHEDERILVQTSLKRLGKMKNMGVYQYLAYMKEAPRHNPLPNIVLCLGLLTSIVLTIIAPMKFLGLLLFFVAVNMIVYFTYKNKSFFDNFSYMSGISYCAQTIAQMDIPVLKDENSQLLEILKPFRRVSRFGWIFVSGSQMGGTLLDLFMDYVKMMFHIDVILFDFVLNTVKKNEAGLDRMMDYIGELDMDIAAASYRAMMDGHWCRPKFETPRANQDERPLCYDADGICHPLIHEPVVNDIHTKRSVLLTGSNASGKSTFLKTVAINTIMAQTMNTVLADAYRADFFRVYSSMALRDNLSGGESYFIVEIKSLKRIVEAAGKKVPMLCFVDEVLRGTNTIERIAASAQILDALGRMNDICFAATHDIELTQLLKNQWDNYHFQEKVEDNQVIFDYKLYKGRAVSRNAIKLLGIIGFENELIDRAAKMAADFETGGQWRM